MGITTRGTMPVVIRVTYHGFLQAPKGVLQLEDSGFRV